MGEREKQLHDCISAHIRQVVDIDSLYKKECKKNAELSGQLEELQTLWKTMIEFFSQF